MELTNQAVPLLPASESPTEHSPSALADSASAFTCGLCGSARLVPFFDARTRDGKWIAIAQCERCRVLTPDYPRPQDDDAAVAQQVRHHEREWVGESESELKLLLDACTGTVDFYRARLDKITDGRVCEIGAGRGGLLAALKRRGYRVLGCEPSHELCRLAETQFGLLPEELLHGTADVLLARIEEEKLSVRAFFLWHVIEHMIDPVATMRRIAGCCRPGDLVIAQCPLLRPDYVFPEHYFFMTEPTILALAGAAGFHLEQIDYDHDRGFIAFALARDERPVPSHPWGETPAIDRDLQPALALKAEQARRLQELIQAQDKLLSGRDEAMAAMARMLEERFEAMQTQSRMVEERTAESRQLERSLRDRDAALEAANVALTEQSTAHARELERSVRVRDAALEAANAAQMEQSIAHARELERAARDRDTALEAANAALTEQRTAHARELERALLDRGVALAALKERTIVLERTRRELEACRLEFGHHEFQDRSARGQPRLSSKGESLAVLLSLHATERLYRRWSGIRGFSVSPLAPSISERLSVFAARKIPAALLGTAQAEDIEALVARIIEPLKAAAFSAARTTKRLVTR